MINRLRIVLVEDAKGKPKLAYLGADPVEAQTAYDEAKADSTNQSAGLFIYPQPQRKCKPAEEKAAAEAHIKNATAAIAAQTTQRVSQAAAHVEAAQKQLEAAKAAHAAIAGGTTEPEESKKKKKT